MGRRVGAWIVDSVIVAAPAIGLFTNDLEFIEDEDLDQSGDEFCDEFTDQTDGVCVDVGDRVYFDDDLPAYPWLAAVGLGLLLLVVLQGLKGWTPGKLLFGIRTVGEDGRPPGIGRALIRWLLLIVDGLCAGLVGFIVALTNKGHRRVAPRPARRSGRSALRTLGRDPARVADGRALGMASTRRAHRRAHVGHEPRAGLGGRGIARARSRSGGRTRGGNHAGADARARAQPRAGARTDAAADTRTRARTRANTGAGADTRTERGRGGFDREHGATRLQPAMGRRPRYVHRVVTRAGPVARLGRLPHGGEAAVTPAQANHGRARHNDADQVRCRAVTERSRRSRWCSTARTTRWSTSDTTDPRVSLSAVPSRPPSACCSTSTASGLSAGPCRWAAHRSPPSSMAHDTRGPSSPQTTHASTCGRKPSSASTFRKNPASTSGASWSDNARSAPTSIS